MFTGGHCSKLAPERSSPRRSWPFWGRHGPGHFGLDTCSVFKLIRRQHPMIFSSCRLRFFCVRGAGKRGRGPSLRQKPVGRRAGQSGEARVGRASPDWLFRRVRSRCSRAKPGSRHDENISGCDDTKLVHLVELPFGAEWPPGYRSGMRVRRMVARTRSSRKIWSCFEGAAWLWRRSWSCFEGAKLFWTKGAKFG